VLVLGREAEAFKDLADELIRGKTSFVMEFLKANFNGTTTLFMYAHIFPYCLSFREPI